MASNEIRAPCIFDARCLNAPGRNRTFNLALKRRLLCLVELRRQMVATCVATACLALVFNFQRAVLMRLKPYELIAWLDADWRERDSNPQGADARRRYRPMTEPIRCPLRTVDVPHTHGTILFFAAFQMPLKRKKPGPLAGPAFDHCSLEL
jgi:hypothetical protein